MMAKLAVLTYIFGQALVGAIELDVKSLTSISAVEAAFHKNSIGYNNVSKERRLDTQWFQVGADIDSENAGDWFGSSVALSQDGRTVAIGAVENDGNGSNSGHVRVFTVQNEAWVQVGQDIDGEASGDRFGESVALSSDGGIVAIGALNNDGNGNSSGHVRVFELQGETWVQLGQDIDGEASGDRFGKSVALSSDGGILAIGAISNGGNGDRSGHVRVFERQGETWVQVGQDIDGEAAHDQSGYSVALSSDGSIVAIGAIGNYENGNNSGHVRVYERQGETWVQLGQDIDGEAAYDQSGNSVALSSDGGILAIGAHRNDGDGNYDSGHVRIYERQGETWVQLGQDIDGEGSFDELFGSSVALSSDGGIVAIGAPNNGGNGSNSGHVRVFERQGETWVQLGQDIDGEAWSNLSGWSVALSSDGGILAIGAIGNMEKGGFSGHVRVFSLNAFSSSPSSITSNGPTSPPTMSLSTIQDTISSVPTPNLISIKSDSSLPQGQSAETIGGPLEGSLDTADTLTAREEDGDLYRQAAGGLAFNITTVRMESEFDNENLQNEVHLVYDYYAPSDRENTTYDLRLYDKDCVTHGENSELPSEFISVSHSDALHLRNEDKEGSPQTSKTADAQVHLEGQGFNGQSQIDIPLDIHQDKVFQSPYFEYEAGSHFTVAHIQFCARFVMFYDINNDGIFEIHQGDPFLEIEAVNFHETLVSLTFNLTQDFQVSDISLQKDAVIERSDNQRMKYELDVYHCEPSTNVAEISDGLRPLSYSDTGTYPSGYAILNSTYEKTTSRVITQSTIVYICLNLIGNSANIGIREIEQLEFIQPASQITSFAIYQRTPNAITTESHYGEMKRKRMVVSTRLVLPFFDNKNPAYGDDDSQKENQDYSNGASNVIAKGTVIMMFQDDANDVRHLLGFNRDLQEAGEEVEETFEVKLGLGYDEESIGYELIVTITLPVAVMLSFLAIV